MLTPPAPWPHPHELFSVPLRDEASASSARQFSGADDSRLGSLLLPVKDSNYRGHGLLADSGYVLTPVFAAKETEDPQQADG